MRLPPAAAKWCHVTWSTARHRKFFNIAAQARFCEHTLTEECARAGWKAEVAMLPDRVHVLVQVPRAVSRERVASTLRDIATRVAHRSGVTHSGTQVWEGRGWCSVLTNAAAVQAVRRHIRSRAASIGEQPPRGADDVIRLR